MSRDFIRQMPGAETFLQKPAAWGYRFHLDPVLLALLVLLAVYGLAILYSAAGQDSAYLNKQAVRVGVAFLVMIVFAQLEPTFYRRWSPWLFALGIIALIAVMIMGTGAKGAQRWLQLPGLPRFQPSELMKLIVPMMISWYLAKRYLPPSMKHILLASSMIVVPVVLILRQPDLGTSIVIAASGMFVLLLAGISGRLVIATLALIGALAPVMWIYVMKAYQKQRVLTFLDPESDPLGAGWNIIQSKVAIGSGGLWGKGWFNGTQSQLDFLPESHTDFIIAVCAEEFGFFGVVCLLALYLLIVFRGIFIAIHAPDSYSRLLAGSLILTFFVYVFVNIGMVSGLLPVVGIPLPLVSYGGTSIVTIMASFGVMMSIHTHKKMLTQ